MSAEKPTEEPVGSDEEETNEATTEAKHFSHEEK